MPAATPKVVAGLTRETSTILCHHFTTNTFFAYPSGDHTPIPSSINDTLQTSSSATQHSEAASQPLFSADVQPDPPEQKATINETKNPVTDQATTINNLVEELQRLKIIVEKTHKSWERHLKFLQNYITQCYMTPNRQISTSVGDMQKNFPV